MAKNERKVRCSFCGKTQDSVKKIIAGPMGVFICDECIKVCENILETDQYEEEEAYTLVENEKLPTPEEIKTKLKKHCQLRFIIIIKE